MREFSLSFCLLPNDFFQTMINFNNLKRFILKGNKIKTSDFSIFLKQNQWFEKLEELELILCELNQNHIKDLSNINFRNLIKLNLNSNFEIGDKGFITLIESNNISNLKYLELGGPSNGCNISLESLKFFFEKSYKNLLYFNINWNKLEKNCLDLFKKKLINFPKIQHINLNNTLIDEISLFSFYNRFKKTDFYFLEY